jgi:hypothetical protein
MAVAVVQEWREEETDRSTKNYDAINERLEVGANPPDGLLVHTAGFFGQGFRVFDVWESEEQFQRFRDERLMPAALEVAGADAPPPETTIYELHSLFKP